MHASNRPPALRRPHSRALVGGALVCASLCALAVLAWPTRDSSTAASAAVVPSARPPRSPVLAVPAIVLDEARTPANVPDPAVAPQLRSVPPREITREERYADLDAETLRFKAFQLGDDRGMRMMKLAEDRFREGRYQTIGILAPGEQTIRRGSDSPLVIERVLPTGEYQVVEFSEDEYPELHAAKREQDWLFAEADRRQVR